MTEPDVVDVARWRDHITGLLRDAVDHPNPDERWRRAFGIVLDELEASLDEQRAWVHEVLCHPQPYGLGHEDGRRLEDVLFGDDLAEAQAALDSLRPNAETLLLRFNTAAERATFTSTIREILRMRGLVRAARHANLGEYITCAGLRWHREAWDQLWKHARQVEDRVRRVAEAAGTDWQLILASRATYDAGKLEVPSHSTRWRSTESGMELNITWRDIGIILHVKEDLHGWFVEHREG